MELMYVERGECQKDASSFERSADGLNRSLDIVHPLQSK